MQRNDIWKLASVCAAMLCLVFTLHGIAREEKETDRQNIAADIGAAGAAGYAKWEPTAQTQAMPVSYAVQEAGPYTQTEREAAVILNETEEEILLRLAMAEAEGESTEGKALVMLSVLNRVDSSIFPDTVEEVVFQETQYSAVLDGRYYSVIPNEDCLAALALVESGWDESQGAMYFENYGMDSWHSRNLEFLFREGNHRFYR